MNSRERMIKTFEFDHPDRIPVVYHPSPAGLYVHGRKLLDLFNACPPDNPIDFSQLPAPAPETLYDGSYHELKFDEWGVEWEFLIFGIQGQVKTYPLADLSRLGTYEFPPLPQWDSPEMRTERATVAQQKKEFLVFRGGISLLEKMFALRPMDEVLMDLFSEEKSIIQLLDRLTAYMKKQTEYNLELGTDVIMFGDDWGIQTGPLVPPELFHRIFRPRYEEIFKEIKQTGRRIFFHSCGMLGPIFDELVDMGIDGIWHQANRYSEPDFVAKCRANNVTAFLHPDRQHLIPFGSPAEIRDRIRRYADTYHELGGGGIFYVEIENDAPWENVKALIESIQEFR